MVVLASNQYRLVAPLLRCKAPKGGSPGETGIPWQPIEVEPIIAKTAWIMFNDAPPGNKQHSSSSRNQYNYLLYIL